MMKKLVFYIICLGGIGFYCILNFGFASENNKIEVNKTEDFIVTGDGTNENWSKAKWIMLSPRIVLNDSLVILTLKDILGHEDLKTVMVCAALSREALHRKKNVVGF